MRNIRFVVLLIENVYGISVLRNLLDTIDTNSFTGQIKSNTTGHMVDSSFAHVVSQDIGELKKCVWINTRMNVHA